MKELKRILGPMLFTSLVITACQDISLFHKDDKPHKTDSGHVKQRFLKQELFSSLQREIHKELEQTSSFEKKTVDQLATTVTNVAIEQFSEGSLCFRSFSEDAERLTCGIEKGLEEISSKAQFNDDLTERVIANLSGFIHWLPRIGRSTNAKDMAVLETGFFEEKTFLMSTSLEQTSATGMDVFNVSSLLTRMHLDHGRLVITKLASRAGGLEEIIAAFPVRNSFKRKGKTYIRVDFSTPENRMLYVPALERMYGDWMAEEGPSLKLHADVILPSFPHKKANKSWAKILRSADDRNFVIDNKILLQTSSNIFSNSTTDSFFGLNDLRPTVRLIQGFFVVDDKSTFSPSSLEEALGFMTRNGLVELETQGLASAVPYFLGGAYEFKNDRFETQQVLNVRKLNDSKTYDFVALGQISEQVMATIKESAEVWQTSIHAMNGTQGTFLNVLSEKQFRAKYPEFEGIELTPADPRLNTVVWNSSPGSGAAWATSLANPRSGEVLSADVFIYGNVWAKIGCLTWFRRNWKKVEDDFSSVLPSGSIQGLWLRACDATLENLGLLPKGQIENAMSRSSLESLIAATKAGDSEIIATLINEESFTAQPRNEQDYERLINSYESHEAVMDVSRMQTIGRGDSRITLAPDCFRDAMTSLKFADIGSPAVDTTLIPNPRDAALAVVKATLIHEFGHLVGLRHNFTASTLRGALDDIPITTTPRTHSVMDYNDIAIDMDFGVLGNDIKHGNLGDWDYLALRAAYGKDSAPVPAVTSPIAFCTDQNALLFSHCNPHDYGTRNSFYRLFEINKIISIIRQRGIGQTQALVAMLEENIKSLLINWAEAVTNFKDSQPSAGQTWDEHFDHVNLLSRGVLPSPESNLKVDPYLSDFEKEYGFPILGILDLIDIPEDFFKNDFEPFRKYDALIIRRLVLANLAPTFKVAAVLRKIKNGRESDIRFLPLLKDIEHLGQTIPVLTDLMDSLSEKIILPVGKEVVFSAFSDSLKTTLEKPAFNHNFNILVWRGDERTLLRRTLITTNDHLRALEALAMAAGGHSRSASVMRISSDRNTLACLLGEDSSPINDCGYSEEGPMIQPRAETAAYLLLETYDQMIELAAKPVTEW